jgi:spoIIIJ-associated protein
MESTLPDPTHSSPPDNTPPPDSQQLQKEAMSVLSEMLPLLSFQARLQGEVDHDCIRIRLESEEAGRLIGRKGSTINEIQFLLNRILQKKYRTIPRIFLDVDDLPQANPPPSESPTPQGNPEILTHVKSMANKARRWGDSVEIGPYAPEDRKFIEELFSKDRELTILSLDPKAGDAPGHLRMRLQVRPLE